MRRRNEVKTLLFIGIGIHLRSHLCVIEIHEFSSQFSAHAGMNVEAEFMGFSSCLSYLREIKK